MPERDDLDRLIDSELARYAEPRVGLQQRILARVQAGGTSQPGVFSRWQGWALVGAAAAIALLLSVLVQRTHQRETNVNIAHSTNPKCLPTGSTTETSATQVAGPNSQPEAKPTRSVKYKPKSIQVPKGFQHPKLDVFPAPQPLSEQEESLVRLATELPKAEREKFLSDERRLDTPLEISSIKISPITMPDVGQN